ncbi:YggT family protein [Actinospica sp.]|jgi:YggT family protein|uniref:YggT family protein n=1 Tax=Actinospica sp. TaxID=1872142 RepID=UPI002BA17D4C|nr:YggT family protein [Actinospica sp.]HWG25761.1 YggT family protein [Actinospica sp.]
MHVAIQVITVVLWVYWILLMFRLVMTWVFQFARSYDPRGVMLVAVESAYTATDPPLKFLRRYIPPLRIGGLALDLAFLLLVIILFLAIQFVGTI